MDPDGADFVHTVTEAMKLAFADREAYYGDPDFVDVPVETLAVRRLQRRAPQACIGATASLRPSPRLRARLRGAGRARSAWRSRRCRPRRHGRRQRADAWPTCCRRERGDTVHIDVDRPLGQHGLGDAVRRLAAILARQSRSSASPELARADVLAGAWPAGEPRARQAAAHDADARRWLCARAGRRWPSARRAATSRSSGSSCSSCATSIMASTCRRRSTCRCSTRRISRALSIRANDDPGT